MKRLTIIILAFFLAACAPKPNLPGVSTAEGTIYDPIIVVKHDDQRNVTCWVYIGDRQGGLFCMTDKEIYGY